MKYYAVIDTNVLVSAMLKWSSVPGNIMELVFGGTIIPVLNRDIVKEYRDVLLRPKFHLTEDIVADVIDVIERTASDIVLSLEAALFDDPQERINNVRRKLSAGYFPDN